MTHVWKSDQKDLNPKGTLVTTLGGWDKGEGAAKGDLRLNQTVCWRVFY